MRKNACFIAGAILLLLGFLIVNGAVELSIAYVWGGEKWITVQSGDTVDVEGYLLRFSFSFDESPRLAHIDVYRKAMLHHKWYSYGGGWQEETAERWLILYGVCDPKIPHRRPPKYIATAINFGDTDSWGGLHSDEYDIWELKKWLDEGMVILYWQIRDEPTNTFKLHVNLRGAYIPMEPPAKSPVEKEVIAESLEQAAEAEESGEENIAIYVPREIGVPRPEQVFNESRETAKVASLRTIPREIGYVLMAFGLLLVIISLRKEVR